MKTRKFNFPFPVADTEAGPIIIWKASELTVDFTTYQGVRCLVRFSEVSHFEFLSEDELNSTVFQYDGAVEVVESTLIERLVRIGEIPANDAEKFTHLVVGFNEIGSYLIVVFRSLHATQV